MNAPPPTVFVVDDDESFRRSISRWLRGHGYSVESFDSAVNFLARRPTEASGCVLADLQMPGMDGMSLQEALAQSDRPLPVVFLTGHGDISTSVTAMRGGAEDFLVKTAPSDVILDAIERALTRNAEESRVRSRTLALVARFAKLTPREREVLLFVLRGLMNKQIAAALGIDERSVKRHRTHLMGKLGVKSVAELARLAVAAGAVDEMGMPHDGSSSVKRP